MTRLHLLLILVVVDSILLLGCKQTESSSHYKFIGQVTFRRTYAGHENWSKTELDSIDKSNPTVTFPLQTSEDTVFTILVGLGIADKDELLINKISSFLKDTVIVHIDKTLDTAFLKYDLNKIRASIQIKNMQTTDSILIKDESFGHTFSLIANIDKPNPYIVFMNQYYIMNGYNYEISLYTNK